MSNFLELMIKRGLTPILTKEKKMTEPKKTREPEYASFVKMARVLVSSIQNETDEKIIVSMLMSGIFRLPSKFTRLVSIEAAELKYAKRTPEHFYGRTDSAKRLVKELKNNPIRSDKAIIAFIKSRCRVHQVTKEQNNILKAYNIKNPNVHWRQAYADCSIILKPIEKGIYTNTNGITTRIKTSPKYIWTVDGITYNSLKEIASKYNITVEGARFRFFKAKSQEYATWIAKRFDLDTSVSHVVR